jgi:hypothetical protein
MSDSRTTDAVPDPTAPLERKDAVDEARAQFANYQEYNKLLRTWFVAFGIGGLVLLYTRPDLLEKLGEIDRDGIIWALLSGSAIQVVLASVNKYCSWQEYRYLVRHSGNLSLKRNCLERWGLRLSNWILIDIGCDLASTGLFASAMIVLARTVLKVAEPSAITMPP